ncbi:MAG: NAD-dependent epimerase/dehydratase family protein [Egibacteraceae bacterium]
MRVLVTGGLGYIGRAVAVRLIDAGHDVAVLTHRPPQAVRDAPTGATVLHADLRDREQVMQMIGVESFAAVCHLAGRSRARESFLDPLGYYETNATGLLNLLRALAVAAERAGEPTSVVNASTVMVYGSSNGEPINEDRPPNPTSPYGSSKLAAEQLLGYQAATGAIGAISLRLFSAAGAVDRHGDSDLTRIIPKALAVAAGRAPHFEVNGDGSAVREFTHIADIADAFLLALGAVHAGKHRLFNVGTGIGVSVQDILTTVESVTGRTLTVVRRSPQNEPAALIADARRFRHEAGWQPTHSTIRQILADAWTTYVKGTVPLQG